MSGPNGSDNNKNSNNSKYENLSNIIITSDRSPLEISTDSGSDESTSSSSVEDQPKPPLITSAGSNKNSLYNIFIVFLVLVLSESARGLVLSSTPSYVEKVGGDSAFLGIVVSAFSSGRFISTLILGYLSSRLKYKKVFIGSVFICIIGSIIYCFAYLDEGAGGKTILVLSRLLLGFGAGTLSAVRAYIAEVSSPKQRTTYIAWASAVQFFGFAITPIIGSSLQYLPMFYIIRPVSFNVLTSPGWFLTIFNSVLFFILIFQFSNPIASTSSKSDSGSSDNASKPLVKEKDIESTTDVTPGGETEPESQKSLIRILISDKQVLKSLIVFVVLNFFVRAILGIFETLATPIYLLLINDKQDGTSGYYFGGMGVLGIFVLLGISYVSKRQLVNDFWILFSGTILIIIGCAVCITRDLGWAKFTIGSVLIWSFGYPLAQTIIVSMFSKTLTSSLGKASQGTLMGLIGAAGSLGRIVGPLISGLMFSDTLDCFNVFWFSTSLAVLTFAITFLIFPKDIKEKATAYICHKYYKLDFINLSRHPSNDELI